MAVKTKTKNAVNSENKTFLKLINKFREFETSMIYHIY